MAMPRVAKVRAIGRFEGLALTAMVESNSHLSAPVILNLQITNDAATRSGYYGFGDGDPTNNFAIWLLSGGRQVPLTAYGNEELGRYFDSSYFDGSMNALSPHDSRTVQIYLSRIFSNHASRLVYLDRREGIDLQLGRGS